MKKLSLFLMSYKGYSVLKGMLDNGFKTLINLVVIGKDKNVENDYSVDIINLCERHNIRWKARRSVSSGDLNSSYALAVSWRWLIKLEQAQLFVIHDSILPKYRGFAPLVNQLIHKENLIGVTLLKADQKYDTGDIVKQSKVQINYPITIEQAIQTITKSYLEVSLYLCEIIAAEKEIIFHKQDETKATYSLWRDNYDYMIDWSKDAGYIERFINAVGFPYTGAKTLLNNTQIIITEAIEVNDVKIMNRDVGKVIYLIEDKPIVVCGKGLLKICTAHTLDGNSVIPLKKIRSRFHS